MGVTSPFWHGCNYPWSTDGTTVFYGMDFGRTVWGTHVGVSTRREAVAADLATMASLGCSVVRWFVFCDGRSGIVYDPNGRPCGLDAHVFEDLDAALEIARDVGIGLVLVLLDHSWMFRGVIDRVADEVSGAMLEVALPAGRAPVLHAEEGRVALVDHVFTPIVERYGPGGARADLAPAVFAYEAMNEPDFVVEEWERDLSPRVPQPLPFELLADVVAALSTVVHRRSSARTTMSAARLHNLWAWDDDSLGLDFLQVHSYPDLRYPDRDRDIFGIPAPDLGCSRPIVLGEFPGNGPGAHPAGASPPPWTAEAYQAFAAEHGYAGAWPWSFSGTDGYGPLSRDALQRFCKTHPAKVNRRALL